MSNQGGIDGDVSYYYSSRNSLEKVNNHGPFLPDAARFKPVHALALLAAVVPIVAAMLPLSSLDTQLFKLVKIDRLVDRTAYESLANECGLELVEFDDQTTNVSTHYDNVSMCESLQFIVFVGLPSDDA